MFKVIYGNLEQDLDIYHESCNLVAKYEKGEMVIIVEDEKKGIRIISTTSKCELQSPFFIDIFGGYLKNQRGSIMLFLNSNILVDSKEGLDNLLEKLNNGTLTETGNSNGTRQHLLGLTLFDILKPKTMKL